MGDRKKESMAYLIRHLVSQGWVENRDDSALGNALDFFSIRLTLFGWAHFEELMRANVESRTAFMAMAWSDERLNKIYKECFAPAVEDAGFIFVAWTKAKGPV